MSRTENVELTTLCLIHRGNQYLLQDRVKKDWKGYTLPGGHVEPGESIVEATIREMQEETGLTIRNPKLCGVKQFPIEGGRYLVFLFETEEFEGELVSSEEGAMHWVNAEEHCTHNILLWFYGYILTVAHPTFFAAIGHSPKLYLSYHKLITTFQSKAQFVALFSMYIFKSKMSYHGRS